MDGHITSSVYFASLASPENARFTAAYAARYPNRPATSADAEAAYVAVRLLAMALAQAGTAEVWAVKRAVGRQVLQAPQGEVRIDPDTMHAALTPRIGRSTAEGQFVILAEAPHPLRADPYLTGSASRFSAMATRPKLRIAS
jgi:branched-chain amino acid transport system substrate-binding protein